MGIAVTIGLVVGVIIGAIAAIILTARFYRNYIDESKLILQTKILNLRGMENRYLEVLRREIGNLIIQSDPDIMLKVYEKAECLESHYRDAPKDHAQVALKCLTDKYPMFIDFDFIGTRHFVPYDEVCKDCGIAEIIEWYEDITNFLILSSICLEDTGDGNITNDKEKEVLKKIIRRIKDKNLKNNIDIAMQRFWLKESILEEEKQESIYELRDYEDAEYVVNKLLFDVIPETKYGITIKSTEEYGIYSMYCGDTGKTSISYLRADCKFKDTTCFAVNSLS